MFTEFGHVIINSTQPFYCRHFKMNVIKHIYEYKKRTFALYDNR